MPTLRQHTTGLATALEALYPASEAASIAGLMLTTEVMVTRIDEDDKKSKVTGAIA